MAIISGYNYYCNDVNGNFGTDKTASGIPISNQHYTLAVPMKDSNYRVGDVLIVRNDKNGTSAVYLATDVGGLPNADVDIVEGVGLKALGVSVASGGEAEKKGVKGLDQKEGFSVQKIGEIDFKDKESVRQFQELSHKINQGSENLSKLSSVKSFSSNVDAKSLDKKLSSYAPAMTPDTFPTRGGGYRERGENEPYRQQEDYSNYLTNLMKEDPISALFMMVIAIIFGMLTGQSADKIFEILGANGISSDNLSDGSKRKAFAQAAVDAPDAWNKAWTMSKDDPNFAKASKELATLTPEAVAKVMADQTGKLTVIQEIKGNGDKSYANMIFKDSKGDIQCLPVVTGGVGNGSIPGASTGTGKFDPRYPDAKIIPDYTIGGYRKRNDSLGKFSFDILSEGKDSISGTGRGAMRFHVGMGSGTSSLGCYHVSEKHGDYFESLYRDKGTQNMKILPSVGKDNILVREVARIQSEEQKKEAAKGGAGDPPLPAAPPLDVSTNKDLKHNVR